MQGVIYIFMPNPELFSGAHTREGDKGPGNEADTVKKVIDTKR